MSRPIRLYVDEDAMDSGVIHGLRLAGIDVLTASEAEMDGRADDEQLEYAVSVREQIRFPTEFIARVTPEEMTNRLEFLSHW